MHEASLTLRLRWGSEYRPHSHLSDGFLSPQELKNRTYTVGVGGVSVGGKHVHSYHLAAFLTDSEQGWTAHTLLYTTHGNLEPLNFLEQSFLPQ